MNPKSRSEGLATRESQGLLIVEDVSTQRTYSLEPLAALIWQNSDGALSVFDLTAKANQVLQRSVSQEEVFTALDFLADAGLLEERVTPPAGPQVVSRRGVLQVPAMALVAALSASLSALPAAGQIKTTEADDKKLIESKKAAEALQKKTAEVEQKKAADLQKKTAEAEQKKAADLNKKTEEALQKKTAEAEQKKPLDLKKTEESLQKKTAEAEQKKPVDAKKAEEALQKKTAEAEQKKPVDAKKAEEALQKKTVEAAEKKAGDAKKAAEAAQKKAAEQIKK